MAFIQYLKFDYENLPLPDSYNLDLTDVEADSGGETEAGTMQRDVIRSGVVTISVSFSVSAVWLSKLSAYAKRDKNKRDILNRSAANEIYDYLTDKESLNRLTDKQKALHGRINKRTQNETVADLLTEAAYLLSLVDNDDS